MIQCYFKEMFFQQQQAIVIVRFLVSKEVLSEQNNHSEISQPEMTFVATVDTTGSDADLSDNRHDVRVKVKMQSLLEIHG